MRSNLPTGPGFYWAKWRTPAPGTEDNGDGCPRDSAEWEPVEVYVNGGPEDADDYLRVAVLGVAASQRLTDFEWSAVPEMRHG